MFLKKLSTMRNWGCMHHLKRDCFDHALYKACQYTNFDEKVNCNLQPMNIKVAQF